MKLSKEERRKLRKEKKGSFISDFKKFITRGNVVDMAVGVVVGGAFSKIVTSFTNGIVMPLIGLATGSSSLVDLKYVAKKAVYELDAATGAAIEVEPEVAVLYGQFLQNILDFLIIALCIFIGVKVISSISARIRKAKEELYAKINAEELEAKKAEQEASAAIAKAQKEAEDAKLAAEKARKEQIEVETLEVLKELKGMLNKNA